MRIRTSGEKEHRKAIIQGLASDLDENQTDAVVDAAEHTRADIQAKRQLGEWITQEIHAGRLSVEQGEEIVDICSGPDLIVEPTIEVDIESGVAFDLTVDSANPGD